MPHEVLEPRANGAARRAGQGDEMTEKKRCIAPGGTRTPDPLVRRQMLRAPRPHDAQGPDPQQWPNRKEQQATLQRYLDEHHGGQDLWVDLGDTYWIDDVSARDVDLCQGALFICRRPLAEWTYTAVARCIDSLVAEHMLSVRTKPCALCGGAWPLTCPNREAHREGVRHG